MLTLGVFLTMISPYTVLIPALVICYTVLKNKMTITLNPLNTGMILAFACALVSGTLSKDILSFAASFSILLYLGICIYFQNNFANEAKVEHLIHLIWRFSIISIFIGIAEKLASYFVNMTWVSAFYWSPSYIPTKEAYRIYSTFGNPNVAGDLFAAMFLIGLYFIQRSQKGKRILYITFVGLSALALIFTGSRGAMLGLEAAMLIYAVFTPNKKAKTILISIVLVMIPLALLFPEMNHSLNSRDVLWHDSLVMFDEKPILGWGLLGILQQTYEIHAHNIWITLLATLGLVGLSIYLCIKYYLFKSLMILNAKGCRFVPLLASLHALIIVHGIVDFTMIAPQSGLLFFVSSALISGLAKNYVTYPVFDWANMKILHPPVPTPKMVQSQAPIYFKDQSHI